MLISFPPQEWLQECVSLLRYVHCLSFLELVYPLPLPRKTEFCHIVTEMFVEHFCLNDCLRYVDQVKGAVVHEMASDSVALVTELDLRFTESVVKV
jgi:hypothetical protein